MFECATCGRELTSDSNYCDVCGSLQPRQQTPYYYGGALDVAYNAMTTLVQIWKNIPEAEKVAVTSAITTYLLTKSSEAFKYLRDWHDKKNEPSPLDATS